MSSRRALLLGGSLLAAWPVRAEDWQRWRHAGLGVHIDYPGRFAAVSTHADNARFEAPDGSGFLVYARPNDEGWDIAAFRRFVLTNLMEGLRVTYRAGRGRWFVVSGLLGELILYERHALSRDGAVAAGITVQYPARLRRAYDPIVTRMSRSFSV